MNDKNSFAYKVGQLIGTILVVCVVACICILAIAGTAKLISLM